MNHPRRPGEGAIAFIAGYSLVKGTLLVVVALGILHYLHHDLAAVAEQWVRRCHFDPEEKHIAALVAKLGLVTDHQLKQVGGLTFFYAGLFLTEGAGLVLKKKWAKYLTIVATASLIPIEIYEIYAHYHIGKVLFFLGNVAIVWFLVVNVRRENAQERLENPASVVCG